jgi:hypothetical protein
MAGHDVAKQEQTEQHVGGGGGGFGAILDYPQHRVLHGVAEAITTNQMRGLRHLTNPTGDGDGDGAPAPSFSKRLDAQGAPRLAAWQVHASDV